MRILVLNSGSSTLKFQVIETGPEQIAANADRIVARGVVERIGSGEALCTINGERHGAAIRDHREAVEFAISRLETREIDHVGHRVVHGGERFKSSAEMTPDVVRAIEELADLAPLHNPANLKGYHASRALLPDARHVAVFDTSFHHTLPPRAFLYGIPYVHYTRDRVRRYGFHGTSHRYVSYRYGQIHGGTRRDFRLITCHLGNGCSVCAIDRGESIDTSMGFTPLEGLIMGTRAGDVDAGALLHLLGRADMSVHELESMLNRYSGLLGISGLSNDMRDLERDAAAGNARAELAIDCFAYRIRKYVGAYIAAMGGADALIFAGGIGENSAVARARICRGLSALGIEIEPAVNEAIIGREAVISSDRSRMEVWVIPTNEELLIARDTARTILGIPH